MFLKKQRQTANQNGMDTIYTIGKIHSVTHADIQEIQNQIAFPLPEDYTEFISKYGFGNINELLMIQQPDPDFVKVNFGDYMDFWDLQEQEIPSVLNSLTIASTIDGDVITVINNTAKPIVILPRHSEEPVRFRTFKQVIEYYNNTYKFNNDLYFDSYYNSENHYISFVKDGKLKKKLFDDVHQIFLNTVSFDKIFNAETQPKYIIQKIGGWVYFDSIGKSAVRVKYQTQFKEEAQKIINICLA